MIQPLFCLIHIIRCRRLHPKIDISWFEIESAMPQTVVVVDDSNNAPKKHVAHEHTIPEKMCASRSMSNHTCTDIHSLHCSSQHTSGRFSSKVNGHCFRIVDCMDLLKRHIGILNHKMRMGRDERRSDFFGVRSRWHKVSCMFGAADGNHGSEISRV